MVENSLAESRTEETKHSQKEVERVCCGDRLRQAGRGCLQGAAVPVPGTAAEPAASFGLRGRRPQLHRVSGFLGWGVDVEALGGSGFSNLTTHP